MSLVPRVKAVEFCKLVYELFIVQLKRLLKLDFKGESVRPLIARTTRCLLLSFNLPNKAKLTLNKIDKNK